MQQRQLRLGDTLDDYCPRERRLTNHSVVAMIRDDVKRTRCNTCEAEHEYKHAKVPRPRRKDEPGSLYSRVLTAAAPPRIGQTDRPDQPSADFIDAPASADEASGSNVDAYPPDLPEPNDLQLDAGQDDEQEDGPDGTGEEVEPGEEGPVHRPLIRATLPRHEGQVPPSRPTPDFTIRQPGGGGRPNRFRPRNQRGGQMFQGNRSGGAVGGRGPGSGRPHQGNRSPQGSPHPPRRHDGGRKRSK
jgi:hypothetical protein